MSRTKNDKSKCKITGGFQLLKTGPDRMVLPQRAAATVITFFSALAVQPFLHFVLSFCILHFVF
ncbi:MAG: hypothetical protein HY673_02595 [Chloroflexi bacterium]|nr:hypothetical protein [Chloroflexota bacterium]